MTKRDALKEARRRWGPGGNVSSNPKAPHAVERQQALAEWKEIKGWPKSPAAKAYTKKHGHIWLRYPCTVGQIKNIIIPFFQVMGRGDTWEAAFADADQREKGE